MAAFDKLLVRDAEVTPAKAGNPESHATHQDNARHKHQAEKNMSGSINVSQMTITDFARMMRMSDVGNFKTSVDKTSGVLYADKSGQVHNKRHFSFSKGDARNNLQLRMTLANAFEKARASKSFLADVKKQLGLTAQGDKASDVADKPLSRREIKSLLNAFHEGGYAPRQDDGSSRVLRSDKLTSVDHTLGEAAGWIEVDTPDNLRSRANELIDKCPSRVPDKLRAQIEQQIAEADPKTLTLIISRLRRGQIDPIPYGQGRRELDLPQSVAEDFKKTIMDAMKETNHSDKTVRGKIKADINREWKISIGGELLPTSKAFKKEDEQDKALTDIFTRFFTKDETSTVKNGVLSMINQNIYTPLSVLPLTRGTLPSGTLPSPAADKGRHVEKTIEVTRLENGDIRVSFHALESGFSSVITTETADKAVRPTILGSRESNVYETNVVYDLHRNKDGNWEFTFFESPSVVYEFGREMTEDELEKDVLTKTDALLADKTALLSKVKTVYQLEKQELERQLESNEKQLAYLIKNGQGTETRKTDLAGIIARTRIDIDNFKPFDEEAFKDFANDANLRANLLKKFTEPDMPLCTSNYGIWDEEPVIKAIQTMFIERND